MKNTYIISLGGSLIVPKTGIDWRFLKKFRELIISQTKNGKKFYIIAGGGVTSRNYITAADKVIKTSDEDRDWLGIHATRLNAHLLRTIFYDIAVPTILKNPNDKIPFTKPIVIGSGWRPGSSTDFVATLVAQKYKIKNIINLSNIDYVYTKDPKKYKDAKIMKNVNWKDFIKIVGTKWSPGLNAPFDPIASQKAKELGLTVLICNGKKTNNLKNYFTGNLYTGTTIK